MDDPAAALEIPALHWGGWWDVFQRGQVADFLTARGAGAPGQYLLMDATDHFDDPIVADGEPVFDIEEDDAALARYLPAMLDPVFAFFDQHLRGAEGPASPTVRGHLANEGWREAAAWPPPGARVVTPHLTDGERALSGIEGGGLAERPDAAPTEARWTHDPASPVPDLIPDGWRPLLGLPDVREVEDRDEVLTFTGETLESHPERAEPCQETRDKPPVTALDRIDWIRADTATASGDWLRRGNLCLRRRYACVATRRNSKVRAKIRERPIDHAGAGIAIAVTSRRK